MISYRFANAKHKQSIYVMVCYGWLQNATEKIYTGMIFPHIHLVEEVNIYFLCCFSCNIGNNKYELVQNDTVQKAPRKNILKHIVIELINSQTTSNNTNTFVEHLIQTT